MKKEKSIFIDINSNEWKNIMNRINKERENKNKSSIDTAMPIPGVFNINKKNRNKK